MSVFKHIVLIWYMVEFFFESIIYFIWGPDDRDEEDVTNKVVLITGASSGIGKAIGLKMAKRKAIVVMACCNIMEGKQAVEDVQYESGSKKIVLMELDLADIASIKRFSEEVSNLYPEIHILINNAGVCTDAQQLKYTKDGFELHMGTNHLGHFLLTNLLLPNLRRAVPSRIVVVSSSTSLFSELNLDDLMLRKHPNPTKWIAIPLSTLPYNNSKLANSLFAKELGKRLIDSGIQVYSVCPGFTKTDIYKDFSTSGKLFANILLKIFGLSPNKSSNGVLYCALSKKCDHETGKFYRFEKLCSSGNRMLKLGTANRLWNISEHLVAEK